MKPYGNFILVTGTTAGIGLGLALRFYKAGNKVVVAARREALLQLITTDHPGIEAIELDGGDDTCIVPASELVAKRYPDLNVVTLDDFLDETLAVLHDEPAPREIIVERAKYLRSAKAAGNYEPALAMLSAWKDPS